MTGLTTQTRTRQALLGLWALPGVGPKALEDVRQACGPLGDLATLPSREWSGKVKLPEGALQRLAEVETLAQLAESTEEQAHAARMSIAYRNDADYPGRLAEVAGAPPVLFYFGQVKPYRPRVAMVGSRRVGGANEDLARRLAEEVARAGVGIVSGAAEGIDTACHQGAVQARGETWAFLGSGLDEIDAGHKPLLRDVLRADGVVFSEFPPDVRANQATFPRRNRLISGASELVLVVRAGPKSGAAHTVRYAREQRRRVMALPGLISDPWTAGTHEMIKKGEAELCASVEDLLQAVGRQAGSSARAQPPPEVDELSPEAKAIYALLGSTPSDFDSMLVSSALTSGALSSALTELELLGLVTQQPGKRYERV